MDNGEIVTHLHDDKAYIDWVVELKERYLRQRLKASCAINRSMLEYYWLLGKDIEAKQYANTYGSGFYNNLSVDLKREIAGVKGFSPTNLKYMYYFYKLYAPVFDDVNGDEDKNRLQPVDNFKMEHLFMIPWFHQQRIIDHCKGDVRKAIFFAKKTLENNWSRDVLLNWLDSNLYEREGKAVSNFKSTLPSIQGDLAQQITKDPYNFDFLTLRQK